jgi:hypothetical protein
LIRIKETSEKIRMVEKNGTITLTPIFDKYAIIEKSFGMFSDGKLSSEQFIKKRSGKGTGKISVFVLDACALIAYFAKEKGSETELEEAVFKKAGYLKSKYKISLADSIALAENITRNGQLITSDHHEKEF